MVGTASQVPPVLLVPPQEPPHPVVLAGELICCNQPIAPNNTSSAATLMGREHANIPGTFGALQRDSVVLQDLGSATVTEGNVSASRPEQKYKRGKHQFHNIKFTTQNARCLVSEAKLGSRSSSTHVARAVPSVPQYKRHGDLAPPTSNTHQAGFFSSMGQTSSRASVDHTVSCSLCLPRPV